MPSISTTKKLNTEQREAIEYGKGPLLIVAGAGTGKTTVITERIVHLIEKKDVKPQNILALTFTEKASQEMLERVDIALPYGYSQMWISTFHSFCDRMLRLEALNIGLDPRYKLMTEAETIQFVREHLFEFDLKYFRPLGNPTKFISGMLQHFSRLQDEDILSRDYLHWSKKMLQSTKDSEKEEKLESEKWFELATAYQKYEELKIKNGKMDYGDLISKVLWLFRERPNILKGYQNQFDYVLVDEFQDTNIAQYELIKLLVPPSKKANITVVGDDSQSIYKFRGAAISNIMHFRDDYPTSKMIVLTKNYRSSQNILDASYQLIQHNNPDTLEVKLGITKNLLSTKKGNGALPEFIHEDRVENEAEAVAKKIQELVRNEDYTFGDVAILVRANNHAEPFIRSFEIHGIPYQFLGPGKLFRQPEIIDLISYLKVLYDFEDSVAFYKVLSIDYFEIDARDIVKITHYAKKGNLSLFEACEKIDEISVSDDTKQRVSKLVAILTNHLTKTKSETAGQLLYYFLHDTGLLSKLLAPDNPEAEKKAQNISRFFDKLKSYEVEHDDAKVPQVVDWLDLSMELGESPLSIDSDWSKINAVNILTVHGSKGLEFPVVFLVNLVSQRFPTIERREQIPIPDALIKEVLPQGDYHIQEERRLFYVGITRAQERLYITAADYYGEGKREKKLSPFIFEALGDAALASEQKHIETGTQLSFLDYAPHEGAHSIREERIPFHVDYLSYSQIETFQTCPLHYKLRYILNIPTPPSAALSFGSSMHAALQRFYTKLRAGEKASEELLCACLDEVWIKEGYSGKDHERQTMEAGYKYLKGFLAGDCYIDGKHPIALEQNFLLPLPSSRSDSLSFPRKRESVQIEYKRPLKIGGKIDRVDELSDGRIEIIDYKTGRVPDQKEVDKNMQMTFYALAGAFMKEAPYPKKCEKITLSLYYFEEQKKMSTVRTMDQLHNAIDEIYSVRKEIEESDFKCQNHMFCENCEFSLFCKMDGGK